MRQYFAHVVAKSRATRGSNGSARHAVAKGLTTSKKSLAEIFRALPLRVRRTPQKKTTNPMRCKGQKRWRASAFSPLLTFSPSRYSTARGSLRLARMGFRFQSPPCGSERWWGRHDRSRLAHAAERRQPPPSATRARPPDRACRASSLARPGWRAVAARAQRWLARHSRGRQLKAHGRVGGRVGPITLSARRLPTLRQRAARRFRVGIKVRRRAAHRRTARVSVAVL